MEPFGKVVISITLLVLSSLFGGFVFAKLWEWFVVFNFGLKPLSIVDAMGLMLIVSLFKVSSSTKEEKSEKSVLLN